LKKVVIEFPIERIICEYCCENQAIAYIGVTRMPVCEECKPIVEEDFAWFSEQIEKKNQEISEQATQE
jgi:NAD-dependent SIR2 family protein deacetylase